MNIDKQISYWKYAAWTLPFLALAGIIFFHWIGWDTTLQRFLAIIFTVFFGISVFWWWWALDKLGSLIKEKLNVVNQLNVLANEIKKLRENLREDNTDVDHR